MNVLPVVMRELRAQARQPFTYRLRFFGVLALLATTGWFLVEIGLEKNVGGALFAALHGTLFYAAVLLVTFSAVDSISRERRDGTLGLLFLTPLTAVDIVLAKVIAHAVRALTLMLAVIPVFSLPMLLGGVSWQQFLTSLLLLASATFLALGAAIVASAICKRWSQALALALVLVAAGLISLSFCMTTLLFPIFARTNTNFGFSSSLEFSWLQSFAILGTLRLSWFPGGGRGVAVSLLPVILQVTALAMAWLWCGIFFAAVRTRRVWREEPPSARRQWIEKQLTRPVVGLGLYRLWLRGLLERNPVGWLERRSWQGRVVTWAWLAIVITVTASALGDSTLSRVFDNLQRLLAWLLVLSIVGTVAGSFRRERETGVLELLLISPLGARRIILGRLLGLWGQFLPAVVLFVLVWGYIAQLGGETESYAAIFTFLLQFVSIPVVGLYFSLRCRSFIGAFLATLAAGVLLPVLIGIMARAFVAILIYADMSQLDETGAWVGWLLTQALPLAVAVVAWRLTYSRLERRGFEFDRVIA